MDKEVAGRIFQTARKGKCPGGVSYPVGAEFLSKALADIPQFDEVVLDFYLGDRQSGVPLCFMCLEYNPNGIGFNLENRWSLAISAVPSTLKSPIRQALSEGGGLTRIKEWLTQSRPPLWFEAYKRLIISFEPVEKLLVYREEGAL